MTDRRFSDMILTVTWLCVWVSGYLFWAFYIIWASIVGASKHTL